MRSPRELDRKGSCYHCSKHVTLQTGYDTTQSQSKSKNLKMEGLFGDLAFLQKSLKFEINSCCKTKTKEGKELYFSV